MVTCMRLEFVITDGVFGGLARLQVRRKPGSRRAVEEAEVDQVSTCRPHIGRQCNTSARLASSRADYRLSNLGGKKTWPASAKPDYAAVGHRCHVA